MEKVSELGRLSEAERHKLLMEWNATQEAYPKDECIHQLFEAQAELSPGAIAAVFADDQLTYRELNRQANQLAHLLRQLGVEPEVLVGIYLERSLDMVAALLGILKAGGAYVPLDPAYPKERLAFMLNDAQVAVLLTQERLLASLPEHKAHVICMDKEWQIIAQEGTQNPASGVTSENQAYVIYTSGSTGVPKGVLGLHRGAINRFYWMWQTFPFQAGEVCCQKTSLSFVDSVWEIFGPLLKGVPTVIIPDAVVKQPSRLIQTLAQKDVTRLVLVPSLLRVLLDTDIDFQIQLPKLKYWVSSGEALSIELSQRFSERVPQGMLFNLYGSSEVSADVTWFDTRMGKLLSCVPIGRPIANTQAYILDPDLQPVPIGASGELHIGGAGLARGYLNRPKLSTERFIPNPFSVEPGARLYKTGDLVRYLPDGNIEFLGRLDHQVKIRGFRIELGEIEAVLRQHPAIRETVVVAREHNPAEQRLAAYIVPHQKQAPSISGLRNYLKEKLPDYMVPAAFIHLDALPLMPNGKVDRLALPAPNQTRLASDESYVAMADELEQQLLKIWEKVLDVQPISIRDNFFELGGDSLQAVRLFSEIEKLCDKNLSLATLFDAPTIQKLANILRQQDWTPPWSSLVALQTNGSKTPFFCVHPGGGNVLTYRELSLGLGSDQPFYALQARGLDGQKAPFTRVEDMAAHYLEKLRSIQPEGPYFLGGLSAGGVIAWEIAQQLHAQGHKVALLALFDTYGPGYPKLLPPMSRLVSVLKWAAVDSILRPWRLFTMLIHSFAEQGIKGTCLKIFMRLRIVNPPLDPEQKPARYESLQSKINRYKRNSHHIGVWEKRLNIFIVHILKFSSFPDLSRRFANTINEDLNDFDTRDLPEALQKVQVAVNKASDDYLPSAYPGRVTYFRAKRPPGIYDDPLSGWGELALRGMDIYECSEAHAEIVYAPGLAEQLKACLVKAQTDAVETLNRLQNNRSY